MNAVARDDARFTLAADAVHVWYVFSEAVTDPRLLAQYAALMSDDERRRHDRFVFDKDRHQFLVTRGIVRTLLAGYVGVDPAECAFVTNAHGKPSLLPPRTGRMVEFNVSHTRGLVACAVTRAAALGVDVEAIDRTEVSQGLAERYFSRAEAQALADTPASARAARFFDYWTLKEAYLKARGLGLSLPLDGFTMHLEDAAAPSVTFTAAIDDTPAHWQFAQFDPSPRHRLAVAVHRAGADLVIRYRELVPAAL